MGQQGWSYSPRLSYIQYLQFTCVCDSKQETNPPRFKRTLSVLLQRTLESVKYPSLCCLRIWHVFLNGKFNLFVQNLIYSFRPTILLFIPSFIHECAESSPPPPSPEGSRSLPPSLPAAAILECWMWWRRGEAGTGVGRDGEGRY